MKQLITLVILLFSVSLQAQQLLMEGGKKTSGATTNQVLKWNGTTWVPSDDLSGAGDDQTFGKGNYSGPTFSGKTITDNVFRRGKISIFTADTAGVLNLYHNDTLNNKPILSFTGDGELFLKVKKDSRSSTGTDINFVRKYGPSGDGLFNNQIVSFGINNTSGGGAENGSYPSIRYAIEENFRNGAGNYNAFECHLPDIYYPPPFNIGRRPISGYYTRNGADLKGHTSFVSDFFVFHNYKDNALKATWTFSTPAPYALGIRFADSSGIYLGKNNYGGFFQRNAANTNDVRIGIVDSDNRVLIGGQNESRVALYNHAQITNGGLLSNENNDIHIGNSSFPTRLTVESADGAGFSVKRTGHAYTATHGLFNEQYYITNPGTGTTPWRINMNAPEYSFWIRSTGRTGFGEANPTARIHATETGGATSPMLAFTNTTGSNIFYRSDSSPEGAITGNPGDLALTNISSSGGLWTKYSGTGTNTGWAKYFHLNDANGASSNQGLVWNGTVWTPTTIDLSSTNELQTLSTSANTVTLSNSGGSFTIAGAGINSVGTSGSTITVTGTEADGSVTNEGSLSVGAGSSTTSLIQSNTSGSPTITLTAGSGMSISETGNTITLAATTPESTTIGSFETTGNAAGLSISGTDIRLHSATTSTPGAIDLLDGQILGQGGKILQNNIVGESTVLTLRNNAVSSADAGPGLEFQFAAANVPAFRIQSNMVGASTSDGAATYLLNRTRENSLRSAITFNPDRTTWANGFWARETKLITTSTYNVTSTVTNRYGHYCVNLAGAAITLPISGSDIVPGTEVLISNVTTSGADATVNTAAAYSEFIYDYDLDAGTAGNQFSAASLSIPAGKCFLLSAYNLSNTVYWRVIAQVSAASAGSTYSIGAFQTTGTANAASISGSDIRIHSASNTTPGAVDLTDNQILGANTKILSEAATGAISTPLILRNPSAANDDDGTGFYLQGNTTTLASIEAKVTGGGLTTGSQLELSTRNGDNVLRNGLVIDQSGNTVTQSWLGGTNSLISTTLDVSSSLTNRKSNFQFTAAGASLTLPITNIAEGTTVFIHSLYESGAASTVNTGAAYSEFAYDTDQDLGTGGNQFYTSTLSVAPMQSVTLKLLSVGGSPRWKVMLDASSSGGGSSSTTLDDAYNNFGATASKITVDAAQGQTGGLEIESTSSNNIVFDLQGTGDLIVQDAGTAIMTINDSGNAGIGPYAPSSSQRLVVSNTSTNTVTTPLRIANGGTVVDGGGTSLAIENNGFDRFIVTASDPSGSYTNQVSLSASSSQEHIRFTENINETRFKQATSRDVTSGTATTYQIDGRTSVIRIPTSATTTTITLPEIVTGDATTNQVNVGYELFLSVNRSVSVSINRAGSDIILVDGATGSYTTLATTSNTIFAKRLIATDVNEWTIYQ